MFGDDDEAVGLLQVGGQLGEELVRRDADGGRQVGLFLDPVLDIPADLLGAAEQVDAAGHVEKGLVERDGLDQRRIALENGVNGLGDLGIAVHANGQEDGVWAQAHCLGRRHGAVDAELADLVGGGADHAAALRVAPDDDGLAPQLRPVKLLDRRVKGVHIDVDDLADFHRMIFHRAPIDILSESTTRASPESFEQRRNRSDKTPFFSLIRRANLTCWMAAIALLGVRLSPLHRKGATSCFF